MWPSYMMFIPNESKGLGGCCCSGLLCWPCIICCVDTFNPFLFPLQSLLHSLCSWHIKELSVNNFFGFWKLAMHTKNQVYFTSVQVLQVHLQNFCDTSQSPWRTTLFPVLFLPPCWLHLAQPTTTSRMSTWPKRKQTRNDQLHAGWSFTQWRQQHTSQWCMVSTTGHKGYCHYTICPPLG